MPKNLRTYLDQVAAHWPDQLQSVSEPVDPKFGVTGLLAALEQRKEFPAVLFTNVKGSKIPNLINLLATDDRIALAMGSSTTRDAIHDQAAREAAPIEPHETTDAPVKEVILTGDQVDLGVLPITTHNELDGGPFICSGATFTRDPDTGAINAGIYRAQVHGPRQLGYFVDPAHHGHYIRAKNEEQGLPTPVAIAIGHHPALLLGAAAQHPGVGGELGLAGGLMGESLGLVKAETQDLLVPAEAEIIIEGYVPPDVRREEGPFGEFPWYYTESGQRPVIEVTAITMRRDAIYQDVNAAHPEHNRMGMIPRAASILRRVRESVPSVKDVFMPLSGTSRLHCYISMTKRVDGEPKQAAYAAMAADHNLKFIVVVDDDIDVFNETEVLWAVATRFNADRDMLMLPYSLGAWLDPSAYDITRNAHGPLNTKLVLDATRPAPPARFPARAQVPAAVVDGFGDPSGFLRPWKRESAAGS
jgi:2,5-furandicarboxylate decarboxylase 1